jgi:hypothetical protein
MNFRDLKIVPCADKVVAQETDKKKKEGVIPNFRDFLEAAMRDQKKEKEKIGE